VSCGRRSKPSCGLAVGPGPALPDCATAEPEAPRTIAAAASHPSFDPRRVTVKAFTEKPPSDESRLRL
jgi:hypothetical protein